MLDKNRVPSHVGIIMDGNRRWAKKQGLAAVAGHAYAVDNVVEQLIEHAGELGIKYLTLWAFSTENWGREKGEVTALMNLFRKALVTKVQKFIERGARLQMIGDVTSFAPDIQEGMKNAMKESEKNDKITVTFALNYGGRDEIVRAVNRMVRNHEETPSASGVPTRDSLASPVKESPLITESELEGYLDSAGTPDPDFIIRTGGEKRTSGFLMWSAAYAEWYFTETLFPDFGPAQFDEAIEEYLRRQRRFGK